MTGNVNHPHSVFPARGQCPCLGMDIRTGRSSLGCNVGWLDRGMGSRQTRLEHVLHLDQGFLKSTMIDMVNTSLSLGGE